MCPLMRMQVCAVKQGAGAFAEECVAHAAGVWRLPEGVDVSTASAIPIVYGTADVALRHRAQLKAGKQGAVRGRCASMHALPRASRRRAARQRHDGHAAAFCCLPRPPMQARPCWSWARPAAWAWRRCRSASS